jgi:hypothetical protein
MQALSWVLGNNGEKKKRGSKSKTNLVLIPPFVEHMASWGEKGRETFIEKP